MKFKVKCDNLYKQLHACQRVIGATTISPILANIYIQVDESGSVSVMATDLEIFYQGSLEAEIEESGAMMVPARNLVEILGTLPQQETLEIISTEDYRMEIKSDNAEYSLFGSAPEDFPSLPDIDEINMIKFPLATFKNMLNKVVYAVSTDEAKRELCGVLLQGDGNNFRMVATDGRRLGLTEIEVKEEFNAFEDVIVPAKVMKEINKFPDGDIDLEMKVCKTQIVFTIGKTAYTSRLIEGKYPSYNNVIPDAKCCNIKIDTGLLLKNLRGIMPIARDISFTVKCRFEADKMEITALSSKIGKGKRTVDITNDGEPITISYNAKYLQDCLNSINSEYVIFEPTSSVKATKIYPCEQPDGEKHNN